MEEYGGLAGVSMRDAVTLIFNFFLLSFAKITLICGERGTLFVLWRERELRRGTVLIDAGIW